MMDWDSGWAWLWMTVMMVIFCGALIVAVLAVFAVVRRPARDLERSSDASNILDGRFARGEIDANEYEQRRRILDGAAEADEAVAMNVLVVLQGPAYGDERSYNGLRLAGSLAERDDVNVRIFCFGDAVTCALGGQNVPDGYYHLDRMPSSVAHHGAEIGLCSTCMDARGITTEMIIDTTRRSSLDEVTDWVLWADKTITF